MENNIENSREKLAQAFKILEKTFENKLSALQENTGNNLELEEIKQERNILENKYSKLKIIQKEILDEVKSSISLIKDMLNK